MENYYLYRLAIWLVPRLPRLLVHAVAAFLAELYFFFARRYRTAVYANLRRVLPPGAGAWRLWRTARAVFRNFAYSIVDFFRIPELTASGMDELVAEVKGWEYIEADLAAGKGGIFATVHMGSWEAAGAYLGLRGMPLTAVALPHTDPRVDEIYVNSRETTGMEVVPTRGAFRRLEDALTRGRWIGMLVDRNVEGGGLSLPFFGERAPMPRGHALLARRTGRSIFPACVYRRADNRLALEICPPIDPCVDGQTTESLVSRCLAALEGFIRRRPEQWFVFYKIWA